MTIVKMLKNRITKNIGIGTNKEWIVITNINIYPQWCIIISLKIKGILVLEQCYYL